MVFMCAATLCYNKLGDTEKVVTFFKFPKSVELSNKWASLIGRYDLINGDTVDQRVCSDHFDASWFSTTVSFGRTIPCLVSGAVPTKCFKIDIEEDPIISVEPVSMVELVEDICVNEFDELSDVVAGVEAPADPDDGEEVGINEEDIKAAVFTNNYPSCSDQIFLRSGDNCIKKRKHEQIELMENYALNEIKAEKSERDSCSLYAELLSKKLRNLNDDVQEYAMVQIDQFLLQLKPQQPYHIHHAIAYSASFSDY